MSEATTQSTAICVLGMHRSGTSVVTRLLNLLGVNLGPDHALLPAAPDNPKGFWEHQGLMEINEDILARFGGAWHDPPQFPEGWAADPMLADLAERARQVLAADFPDVPLWGWKDPRTCLTLPFWQQQLRSMRFVLALRNPRDVVASLQQRDGIQAGHAEHLWLSYLQASLAHSSGEARLFTFYDDLVGETDLELRRLAAFIGCPERADDPQVREAAADFIEHELHHHRTTLEDVVADRGLSLASTGVYLAVKGLAPRDPAADGSTPSAAAGVETHRTLDLLAARALEAWEENRAATRERTVAEVRLQQLAAQARALKMEREAEAARESEARATLDAQLQQVGAERDRVVTELCSTREMLRARTAAIDAQTRALKEARQAAAELDSRLQSMTLARDRHAADLEAARDRLQQMQSSLAWALATKARQTMVRLLPAGTRRRRLFDAVIRRYGRAPAAPESHPPFERRAPWLPDSTPPGPGGAGG